MTTNIVSTLTIRISERSDSSYIEASGLGVDAKSLPFTWTPTEDDLEIIDLLHSDPEKVSEEQLIALGQALYKSVFTPEIILVYDRSNKKLKSGDGIRIRLIIETKNLSHIPWEVMHDGQDFISLYSEYPLVRGTRESFRVRQSPVRGPIRILYVWSEPKDLPSLNLNNPAQEIKKLIGQNKRIKFEILPNATVVSLRKELLSQYHVVCFAGHGTENHIYLETKTGHDKLSAKELARELEGRPVQLVFLAACKTAGTSSEGLASFAQTLANETPIPAIAAMQYEISDDQANLLAARYFETIANFRPLDVALAESRKALLKEKRILRDVFAPVIYLQSKTSNLFQRARNWWAIGFAVLAIIGGSIAYFQNKVAATAQIQVTEQKNIADTRQLANIANSLSLEQGDTAILSGLLAVEAAKRYPELDSDQALRNFLSIAALPISEMKLDGFIVSVDFSPNGKWIAAASINGTTKIWDQVSGRETIQLEGDSSFVKFSSNGKWLATINCEHRENEACFDNAARIWDTNNWQEVSKMTNGDYVHSVAFSDDSKWVVSGGQNNTISIWEAATGQKLSNMIRIDKEDYNVSSVEFSPNGKLVVSGGTVDFTANVWDIATGQNISQMVHDSEVQFVSFSPDSKWIVSGGLSNNVLVWDAYTGNEISRFALDGFGYKGFFSPDSKLVAVQGRGQNKDIIVIWNLQTGKEILRTSGGLLSFSPDSKYILTGGALAKVWNAETGTEIRRMVFDGSAVAFNTDGTRVAFANQEGIMYIKKFPINQEVSLITYDDSVLSIAFSPNSQWIASASHDGITKISDALTGKEISRVTVDGIVVDVDFSSDGKWVAQGACEGTEGGKLFCPKPAVRIWDTNTGKEIYNLKLGYAVGTIKFVPDNKRIITAGQHGNIELWDLFTEKILTRFQPTVEFSDDNGYPGSLADFINAVDIDSKGHFIATGIYKTVQVWDLDSGREVYKLTMDGRISRVAFSPDGKWIASTDNTSIRIWNPENGNELMNISLDSFTGISSVSFSPDEKWIMGNDEDSIRVWEIPTGREISRITKSQINSLVFSPDGKWIASGGNDNTVRLWLWRPEDLITEACSRLPRNLTFVEWKQYIGTEPYKPTCSNLPNPTE